MVQKEASNMEFTLAILILFVFALAGGLFADFFTNLYNGFYDGLAFGFLVGLGVLLTVDYAWIRTRRN